MFLRVFISVFLILVDCSLTTTAELSFISKANEQVRNDRFLQKRASPPILRSKPKLVPKPVIQIYTVNAEIKYRYATTTIFSGVFNSADVAQEVSFIVTIPDSAFISEFLLIVKGKSYKAHIKQKDQAKEEYDRAKESGQTAGHVQLNDRDSNMFKVSVNVEAKSTVGFNLTYEQLLQRTLGFYENQMNISPGQVVDTLNVIVNVQESALLTKLEVLNLNEDNDTIELKQHKNAIVSRLGNKAANIRWNPTYREQEAISENGMKGLLVIRYDVDRKSKSNQIVVDRTYFAHFIAPTNLTILPKYLVFVLDISGSMTAAKLNQLKTSMDPILIEIREDDYFSIVLFSRDVQIWSLKGEVIIPRGAAEGEITNPEFIIQAKRDNIYAAIQFINNLEAGTSTNIIGALRNAMHLIKFVKQIHHENYPIVFFLSDGDPNEEESDPREIIKKISDLNSNAKCSIFSLAFGEDSNFKFLDALSKSNGGFAKKIYVASDTATQLTDFYKQISSLLMSDISVRYDPKLVNASTVTSVDFTNYFAGSELVVAGKLSDGNKKQSFDLKFDANYCDGCDPVADIEKVVVNGKVASDSGPLERLWAFMRVKQLLDQDLINGTQDSSLREEALSLSLKYSFVTPLTSLVVVKPNETSDTNIESIANKGPKISPSKRQSSRVFVGTSTYGPPRTETCWTVPPEESTTNPYVSHYTPLVFDRGGVSTTKYVRSTPATPSIHDNKFLNVAQSSQRPKTDKNNPFIKRHPSTYSINDVKWLNRTSVGIMIPYSKYIVDTTIETNLTYESCISVKNPSGYCKHMKHCLLEVIVKNQTGYLAYQCVINGTYAGVCCPEM